MRNSKAVSVELRSRLLAPGNVWARAIKESEIARILMGNPEIAGAVRERLSGLPFNDPAVDRVRHEFLWLAEHIPDLTREIVHQHFTRKGMSDLISAFWYPPVNDPATAFGRAESDLLEISDQEQRRTILARVTDAPKVKAKVNNFYRTREWQRLRYEALQKYGRKCMCCGESQSSLHVDHIKPRAKYPELELAISNLQVLCEDCNMGKGAWDETDFRVVAT